MKIRNWKINRSESLGDRKSDNFTSRVVNLYLYLCGENKEFVGSKQPLRSETSIGENLAEDGKAIFRRDFRSQRSIADRESRKTQLCIYLLKETGYLQPKAFDRIHPDAQEIRNRRCSIVETTNQQKFQW